MQFLGSLGININVLIAQIVNFGLLMLVLSYFVYKPTIKVIEENERSLQEGDKQKKLLEKEKESFAEEQKKTLVESRERNRKSVKELAVMTETIKSRAHEATKEDYWHTVSAIHKFHKNEIMKNCSLMKEWEI